METIVGPQPGKIAADIVRRVLDLAYDEGHPDPRHSEHWWDWKDWPVDGRQWEYDGQLNRYFLDKKINAEWERRTKNLPANSGMEGSGLRVERKLEGGLLWGEAKFPNGRSAIRSSRSFCPPSNYNEKWRETLQNEGIEISTGDVFMRDLFREARDLTKRSSYDASIRPKRPIQSMPMSDQFKRDFDEELYGSYKEDDDSLDSISPKSGEDECGIGIFDAVFYICTDSFATRGEQLSKEVDNGVPSLSVSTSAVYTTPQGDKTVYVIAEAPVRTMGFVDACHDRIAGFVFEVDESSTEEGQPNATNIIYVESAAYDLDTLDHDEKDAVLEDRALIVHRLLKSCPGVDAQNLLLQEVLSPTSVKPEATFPPPLRVVSFMQTTHRADPRWPLAKPNSLCLECGKDPTATPGGKLLHCSKCNMRKFCSSECMAKSWKSDTWCHKMECKRHCKHEQSQVGTSMEEMFKELFKGGQFTGDVDEKLSMIADAVGEATLKEKYDSVEEMRDAHREQAREARKAKRDGKKGKKKKGKKK